MGKTNRKRKRELNISSKYSSIGIASVLNHLQKPPLDQESTDSNPSNNLNGGDVEPSSNEWFTVRKNGKHYKTRHSDREIGQSGHKETYPALVYSTLHNLQSSLKIADLQGLVLYCLADGVGPQWISVKSHSHIKKAVVLLVPGLEKGMFDGSISLQGSMTDSSMSAKSSEASNGSQEDHLSHVPSSSTLNVYSGSSISALSPDSFMPVRLVQEDMPAPLKPLADMFAHRWPVRAPGDDRLSKLHSPLHAMLAAPISKAQEGNRGEGRVRNVKPAKGSKSWENIRTPVTEFIATTEEMLENEYKLHPSLLGAKDGKGQENDFEQSNKATKNAGWVNTSVEQLEQELATEQATDKDSLTAGRLVLAMDCEMCKVEGGDMALTRISLVGWDATVIMDELVKPEAEIIDYLTPYSGITPEKLAPITTTLKDIQARLLHLLTSQSIIVGHSLNADLAALKITHPFVIDTSILYPHPRGPPMKSSLKWLAQKFLKREIQKGHGVHGHDSIEDARACLDLVKLKCERGPNWGSGEITGESIFKRLGRTPSRGNTSSTPDHNPDGRRGAIVDHGTPDRNFGAMASFCIGCSSDAEVVNGVRRAVFGDADGKLIPGGGVEFTWARLRELEILRGWSKDHRCPQSTSSSTRPVSPKPIPSNTLGAAVTQTVQHIKSICDFLPPCTLLIVYTGTGDPQELSHMQDLHKTFRNEFKEKKWDELSVKWTDAEEQALRSACRRARKGLGFMCVV